MILITKKTKPKSKALEAIVDDGFGFNGRENKRAYAEAKRFLREAGISCSYERRREDRGPLFTYRAEDGSEGQGFTYKDLVFVSRDGDGNHQKLGSVDLTARPDYYVVYTPEKRGYVRVEYNVSLGHLATEIADNAPLVQLLHRIADKKGWTFVLDQEEGEAENGAKQKRYVAALILAMKQKDSAAVAKELGAIHHVVSMYLGDNNK